METHHCCINLLALPLLYLQHYIMASKMSSVIAIMKLRTYKLGLLIPDGVRTGEEISDYGRLRSSLCFYLLELEHSYLRTSCFGFGFETSSSRGNNRPLLMQAALAPESHTLRNNNRTGKAIVRKP